MLLMMLCQNVIVIYCSILLMYTNVMNFPSNIFFVHTV